MILGKAPGAVGDSQGSYRGDSRKGTFKAIVPQNIYRFIVEMCNEAESGRMITDILMRAAST